MNLIKLKRAYEPSSPDDGYRAELDANPAFAALKKRLASKPAVTLIYSSRDNAHNNAQVLEQALT